MVKIVPIVVGELGTNTYLLVDSDGLTGAVIDPGADADVIDAAIAEHGCRIDKIVLTHGHADHIGAADELRAATKAKVYIHEAEAAMAADENLNLSCWIDPRGFAIQADEVLQDGQVITLAGQEFTVLHTPGHTPGGICLYNEGLGWLISGDTLFEGSIGRTDLPGGDPGQLYRSLEKLLVELPENTKVFPGHGGPTTLLAEKGVLQRFF